MKIVLVSKCSLDIEQYVENVSFDISLEEPHQLVLGHIFSHVTPSLYIRLMLVDLQIQKLTILLYNEPVSSHNLFFTLSEMSSNKLFYEIQLYW